MLLELRTVVSRATSTKMKILCILSTVRVDNHSFQSYPNPIHDGPFRSCLRMGDGRGLKRSPSPKFVTHISCNDAIWYGVIPHLKKV